jgi:hypothetical protein
MTFQVSIFDRFSAFKPLTLFLQQLTFTFSSFLGTQVLLRALLGAYHLLSFSVFSLKVLTFPKSLCISHQLL